MDELTDAQRAKAMLLGVKNIEHGVSCGHMKGINRPGFYIIGFFNKKEQWPNRTGTAFDNADDLLNALAAPEKHNCEWR